MLRDIGVHRFKDLPEPEQVWQLEIAGLPADFPPLRSLDAPEPPPEPGPSPFQGLDAFDVEDAERFFGREALTAKLIEQLRDRDFLAVVGASGSGKSSVVRAGLVAAIRRDSTLLGGDSWVSRILIPTDEPTAAFDAAGGSGSDPDASVLVVNVAARLASSAGPGELLVTDTAAAAAGVAGDRERRYLDLKGKSETVPVVVLGVRPSPRSDWTRRPEPHAMVSLA